MPEVVRISALGIVTGHAALPTLTGPSPAHRFVEEEDVKAVHYRRTGDSSVLELVDRPVPEVSKGEVRVRIVVSGVNPTDWKSRAGSGSSDEFETPKVPNQDGAGFVDAIGDDVEHVRVGHPVWVWDAAWQRDDGTAQEYVVLPEYQVVPLPDDALLDVGASVGIPALTAHRALTASETLPDRLTPASLHGRTILVTGGAGAVGHAAIQLAVWAGATVITTVSSDEKAALARAAGAHHIINYRSEDVAARVRDIATGGVDVIVDVNPYANLEADLAVIAPSGTISLYATDSSEPLAVPFRESMVKNIRFQFILTYTTTSTQKQNAVDAVSDAIADGALAVGEEAGLPLHRFALAETAQAHDAVENNTVGKVLIDVTQKENR